MASIPLELRWDTAGRPLPLREVRGATVPLMPSEVAPPWLETGPRDRPFDFCGRMRFLCAAIAERCDEFAHIDASRVLIAFTQARNAHREGLQARTTPLRFPGGRLVSRQGDTDYQVQRLFLGDREALYVLNFCLPRFLDADFDDKLVTLFHELYHISPAFDGDLRRHGGRYDVHTSSQRKYDEQMAGMAREYLRTGPDPVTHDFLRLTHAQLRHRHGTVVGAVIPRPKMVPLTDTP